MIHEKVFAGTATVLGSARTVRFDSGHLTVGPLSYEEALQLVEQLENPMLVAQATGTSGALAAALELVGKGPPGEVAKPAPLDVNRTGRTSNAAPNGAPPRRTAPEPKLDEDTIASLAASNPAPAPKEPKAPKGTKAKTADAPPPATDPVTDNAEPEEEDVFAEGAKQQAEKAAEEAAAGEARKPQNAKKANGTNGAAKHAPADAATDEEELPEALLASRRMKDVLAYLLDVRHMTDVKEIKAECVRLRTRIKFLGDLDDIEGRVDRTLEVMDFGGDRT